MVPSGGGGINPAPNVSADFQFDLTPGKPNAEVPINYISTTGIKLFDSVILELTELFDGESKSDNLFNEKLEERAKQSGWMETGANTIMIPDSTRTPRNLIT